MKKNNIILISLIIVVLTALCTIAGTYAVIINVTNENGTDKIINNIMREINWDGSNDIEKIKIFNKKFKEVFKLDFTKENYSKIIMWRYKSEKDLKRKLTPEEEILNEITALAPKEKTIDFYADKQNINKLLIT